MSQTVDILEFTRVTQARQVDEEKGILFDLVCLGPNSANGRDYPESTMRAALPLFEGKQSFANHSKDASVYDVLGIWQECRVEGGKVRGNFHYFKSHPFAPRLVEAARRPELTSALGFSINARGSTRHENGRQVVESLADLVSIDCVAQAATVSGLYESRGHVMKKKWKELAEALKPKRPGYARALKEMAEAGILGPETAMDEPADVAAPEEGKDHEQALKDGFRAAINAALDDDSMDLKAKIKKISEILKTEEKLLGNGGSDDSSDDAPAEESRRLKDENARLLAEKLVRKAASAAGIALTERQVELAARPGLTEAQAAETIKELWGNGAGSQRPRSAGPLPAAGGGSGAAKPVQEGKDQIPADVKSRAAWLLRG